MPIQPFILNNARIDPELREYLRIVQESVNQLESNQNRIYRNIADVENKIQSPILNEISSLSNPVDPQFNTLTQQQPYVTRGTSVPDLSDPRSIDGNLFILEDSSGNVLGTYQFDGRSEPGEWEEISSVSSSNYFETNNTTDVTANANSTAQQNLMSISVAADALNDPVKVLRLYGAGLYSTQVGQTPTYRFRINANGPTTLVDWTSAATTAATSNGFWQFTAYIVPTGTGNSVTMECDGILTFALSTASGGDSNVYQSISSPSLDLTVLQTFTVTVQISTQPAAPFNVCTQRLLVTEILG